MKLFLAEDHSDRMRRVWSDADTAATTRLTLVELRSALARARVARRISPTGFRRAKTASSELLREAHIVEPDTVVLGAAAELAEEHALRAFDAVQLASALALAEPEIVFASWDEELRRAARVEGLALVS